MQGFGQSATSWRLSQVTESRTLSGWLNWVHKSLLYRCVDVWARARMSPPACFSPTFLYNAWLLWTDKFSISPAAKGRFHLFVLRYYPWCCYSDCQWEHCAGGRQWIQSWLVAGGACICVRLSGPIHFSVTPLPFCFSSTKSHTHHASATSSWTSASSIWSRLWPCSLPGSRTLTSKALLSTAELSESTPSVTTPGCLRPAMSPRSWPPLEQSSSVAWT